MHWRSYLLAVALRVFVITKDDSDFRFAACEVPKKRCTGLDPRRFGSGPPEPNKILSRLLVKTLHH